MPVRGHSIVAGRPVVGSGGVVVAVDPQTGRALDPPVSCLDVAQLTRVTTIAARAGEQLRDTSPAQRGELLERVAVLVEELGDELVDRAAAETGLPRERLLAERARTVGQLRMFADVARRGDHLGVRIDSALPDRQPLPRPDLRMRRIPLGAVAVFGSSNFPLAFSTAGGDTASALAAGCPVVVKAHPAHPGTAELVGQAVARAVADCGLPDGAFALVFGADTDLGAALVADPRIAAVAFTGSRAGGLALTRIAAERDVPIPVYAEMSAVNPVIVLPGALAGPVQTLAEGYVGSVTLGAGQYCTNPGLLFLPAGPDGDRFLTAVGDTLASIPGQTMLTSAIGQAYTHGVAWRGSVPGVSVAAHGRPGVGPTAPAPVVHVTDTQTFQSRPELTAEVFGAAGLVVRYADLDALTSTVRGLEGQLTATIHGRLQDADRQPPGPTDSSGAVDDTEAAEAILPVLEQLAGRIVWGGWPTGVEVGHAMVHGGPYPATSDARWTSVGSSAVDRFQRPVCYQDVPAALQPPAVRDGNPWGLSRTLDGRLVTS